MDSNVDQGNRVSSTQINPLFDPMGSRPELPSIQPDDLKPARRKRLICISKMTVYLVLQTALSFFLLYKETSLTDQRSAKLNNISLKTGPAGPQGPPGAQGPTGCGATGERGNAAQDVKVRLVPGPQRGRVEVKYEDVWGTVCDDSFDLLDAKVICKMLGFQRAVTTFTDAPGTGNIWLNELRCTGAELDIFHCPSSTVGVHNCNHYEDAGVQCA